MPAPTREQSIFVNCPFDDDYRPLADAIAFAILACGFTVRSAAEIIDSGELRLLKIIRLIQGCGLSIHDISRVELDVANRLPRFNMPLELGISLGMKHLGTSRLRAHAMLILDSERYRYQKFASDLSGVDISAHDNDPRKAIKRIRNFLATHIGPLGTALPGSNHLEALYDAFEAKLPDMALAENQHVDQLEHVDRLLLTRKFLLSLT